MLSCRFSENAGRCGEFDRTEALSVRVPEQRDDAPKEVLALSGILPGGEMRENRNNITAEGSRYRKCRSAF